jgi:hypothetical protein
LKKTYIKTISRLKMSIKTDDKIEKANTVVASPFALKKPVSEDFQHTLASAKVSDPQVGQGDKLGNIQNSESQKVAAIPAVVAILGAGILAVVVGGYITVNPEARRIFLEGGATEALKQGYNELVRQKRTTKKDIEVMVRNVFEGIKHGSVKFNRDHRGQPNPRPDPVPIPQDKRREEEPSCNAALTVGVQTLGPVDMVDHQVSVRAIGTPYWKPHYINTRFTGFDGSNSVYTVGISRVGADLNYPNLQSQKYRGTTVDGPHGAASVERGNAFVFIQPSAAAVFQALCVFTAADGSGITKSPTAGTRYNVDAHYLRAQNPKPDMQLVPNNGGIELHIPAHPDRK